MGRCSVTGGCLSDYVAISISSLSLLMLLARSAFPFLIYKLSIPKGSAFWIPAIQIFASFNLLASVVMSVNLIKFEKRHWWQSCYVWAVWAEGPFGFGLLLSCRIVQVYHLYFVFVKKRLPAIRSRFFLSLILLPWIAGATCIHIKKPLNYKCQMNALWTIPVVFLHSLYVVILVGFTRAIRHVDFRFHELKDLWRGVLVSSISVVGFEVWHLELIAGLVVLISVSRCSLLNTWPDFTESSESANTQVLTSLQTFDYLIVAFLPGISEELLFRGALLPLFGLNWKSALAVAAVFGVLHLGSGRKISFAIWATFVGLAYGYATIVTSSVVVPMTAHSLNNLIGTVIWYQTSRSSKQ